MKNPATGASDLTVWTIVLLIFASIGGLALTMLHFGVDRLFVMIVAGGLVVAVYIGLHIAVAWLQKQVDGNDSAD